MVVTLQGIDQLARLEVRQVKERPEPAVIAPFLV
jgi:hypothetical protein